MSKHTPGPWKAVHSDPAEGADVWWICAGEGNSERELGSMAGGYPHDTHEANARLIAAAPEMLEALKMAAATHSLSESEPGLPSLAEVGRAIAAVIAKAEGK